MTRLNMIPFTHVSDYEQFRQGLENFWTPYQIPMGQDSLHFNREMGESFRQVWRRNLANLTTSDVEIMDNVGLGILTAGVKFGLLEAPETRMMLAQQAFQEALHTLSYQHIIESVGMSLEEQEMFYNMWQTVPAMKEKVDYAASVTVSLSTIEMSDDSFYTFVRSCFFYWGIYEGIWFQAGFNPNLAITKFYNMTPGTAEQLAYIQRDESEHIKFGMRFLKRLVLDASKEWRDELYEDLRELISHALELEEAYINWLYEDGQLVGYNPGTHLAFCRYLANTRMAALGFPAIYTTAADYPRWRDEMLGRMESNFFEKHVKEYRVGSQLRWDDEEGA